VDFELIIPRHDGGGLEVSIDVGQTLFVLGANGTGKSALMTLLYGGHQGRARRISAHRQTWMNSNAISLSPEQKRSHEIGMIGIDAQPTARWKDDYSAVRPTIAVYDLIDAENVRARAIAGAVDGDDMPLAKLLSGRPAPIKIINELLRLSNIPVEIAVKESDQIIARKSGGRPYSAAELSDGERSALLVAATVLTAKPGTLILIDEPERHLHRSIISPLLTHLFARRPDCAFVISTHEVNLPLDNPSARTLLVWGCTVSSDTFISWDADLVPPGAGIDEGLKRDILGARRKLLFVEGETTRSLDTPLYGAVFKDVSVIARGSSRDVEQAVAGVRGAHDLHWLRAFGIVDNDGRSQAEIDQLKGRGIYAVSVFSVESVYYEPEIHRRVAERHAEVTGEPAAARVAAAKAAAIAAIVPHVKRLSERVVEKSIREQIMRLLPTREQIVAAAPVDISFDVAGTVAAESSRLQAFIDTGNLAAIIGRYPVRETQALAEIAVKLGFQNRGQYEGAVRTLLTSDEEARAIVEGLFGTPGAAIAAP
jgi:ABC-type branched-subunit amino acid transport system ATPase component